MRKSLLAVIVLAVLLGSFSGCRSTRYSIGMFFSPDWMRTQESMDKYALYTNNAQHYYQIGTTALMSDDDPVKARRSFRQAETQFKQALEYDSWSFKAYLGAGFAMFAQDTRGKCLEAVDYLEIAEDLRGGEWRVEYGLARCNQLLARQNGARANALEARQPDASEGEKLQIEARIRDLNHQRNEFLEQSLVHAHGILKRAPDQHQGFLLIGTTCSELHQYGEAIPNLKKYIALAKQTREVFLKWKKEGVLPAGLTGSSDELNQKIQNNLKHDGEAKSLLATIYKNQGDYLHALEYLDSIYEVNPSAPGRYLPARAWVKTRLDDYRGAVDDLDHFIRTLGASGRNYDSLVRRAMADREKYMTKLRRGPGRETPETAPPEPNKGAAAPLEESKAGGG